MYGRSRRPCVSDLRAYAGESHGDQPADCGPGGQAPGRTECMKAVGGQLCGGDVGPDLARVRGRDQQLPEEFGLRLVRPGDVLPPVDKGRHLRRAVSAPVVRDEGVGGEHRFQLLRRVAALLVQGSQLLEVRGDVPLVGGDEDRLDVGEALVERRPPDAGSLAPSIGGLPVLVVVTALSTYKPRGLTRYGWRRQQAERGRRREAPSASMP